MITERKLSYLKWAVIKAGLAASDYRGFVLIWRGRLYRASEVRELAANLFAEGNLPMRIVKYLLGFWGVRQIRSALSEAGNCRHYYFDMIYNNLNFLEVNYLIKYFRRLWSEYEERCMKQFHHSFFPAALHGEIYVHGIRNEIRGACDSPRF